MTEKQLREIEERAKKATAGDWSTNGCRVYAASEGHAIARTYGAGLNGIGVAELTGSNNRADAEFIAHAKRDILALVSRVRGLERENAALREGSDIAGLSALSDIREALGVGGRPCLFELAGLVREKVERVRELESVAEAAAVFFQDDTASHNAVKRLVSVQGALRAAGYLKEGQE